MAKKKIEFDEVCKSCNGTGLYVGYAERDGFAVVCYKCKGTGRFHFVHEYEEFEKLQIRDDIKQVVEANPGICLGVGGECTIESFGGMSYQEWLNQKVFPKGSEMRKYTCPAWWYQTANYKLKPEWKECLCCGAFSSCENFPNKIKCWERFDKENG